MTAKKTPRRTSHPRGRTPGNRLADASLPTASLGEELTRGLTGLRDALRDEVDLAERFTMRTVRLELEPPAYGSEEVRELRRRLRASQAVFAKLLGVSVKTVQAWEQGSPPPPIARRLFELMEGDLGVWEDLLQAAASHRQRRAPA